MPTDLQLPLRRAIIERLRSSQSVLDIVDERVYDQVVDSPRHPFLRYGVPVTEPYDASGLSGIDSDLTIHAFDQADDTARVYALMKAVEESLDEAELDLSEGSVVWIMWTGSQLLPGSLKRPHGIVTFSSAVAMET